MCQRRDLAERLEDVLVDVIENGDLDAFSNYLLDVSSLTWQLEYKMINEEEFDSVEIIFSYSWYAIKKHQRIFVWGS